MKKDLFVVALALVLLSILFFVLYHYDAEFQKERSAPLSGIEDSIVLSNTPDFLMSDADVRDASRSRIDKTSPPGTMSADRKTITATVQPLESTVPIAVSRMVRGLIIDELKKPIADVSVTIVRRQSSQTTLTQEQVTQNDGRFAFKLENSKTYSITAEKTGYVPINIQGSYNNPDPLLIMKKAERIIGCVEDERRKPVRFARINIRPAAGSGHWMMNLQAKEDGTFATEEELTPGQYIISASQEVYYDIGKGSATVNVQSPPLPVYLSLASRLFEIRGRVEEYGTGDGVPGMKTVLWAWGFGGTYNGQMGTAVSDGDGNFGFQNIPPGEYVVAGWTPERNDNPFRFAENARESAVSLRHNSVDSVVMYAAKAVILRGRVVDEKSQPVADANVIGMEPRGEKTSTDGDGRFTLTLPQIDVGNVSRYRILASKTSDSIAQYAISDWLESRNGQAIDSVVLALENGLTLMGRAIDRNGQPVVGASLGLKNQYTGEERDTISDDAGGYEFQNVMTTSFADSPHDAAYTLITEADGFASALHILNPSGGQGEMVHDVILDPSLRIAGRVTNGQNQPLDGVRVYASRPGCPGTWELTNSEGIYGFEDVLPGRYDLLFQYTERPLLTGYLWGISAGNEQADIALKFKPIALIVHLDIQEGIDRAQPFSANLFARLCDGSLQERNGVNFSLNSSSFSIMIWEAGTYQLRVYVPNCPIASAWVVAEEEMDGDSIEITLPIGPPSPMNTLTGVIQSIPGFTCRFVQGTLRNFAPIGWDGRFRLTNVPDGFIDLVLWIVEDETGMPIKVDALIDRRVEGGIEWDMGEISVGRFFNPETFLKNR